MQRIAACRAALRTKARQTDLRTIESGYEYKNKVLHSPGNQTRREWVHMTYHGFKLIIGDFLARSVRGIPCSPPRHLHIQSL